MRNRLIMKRGKKLAVSCVCAMLPALLYAGGATARQLAFPGAEGFGAYAEGGRGGDVYTVTNLNDSGEGSLRNGIESATGPRTIVFAVSGLIQLDDTLHVDKDHITIAGQTAPGDGICLRDCCLSIKADDVIVRFIRSRLGDDGGNESDAISISQGHNVILDHCSASWSVDECFSCSTGEPYKINNITVQWSIISEALGDSIHHKGYHSYGALIRGCYGARYSYHHNLWAHCNSRMPRPGNYDKNDHVSDPDGLLFDFRNNVIYNWGGDRPGYDSDDESACRMNFVNNYAVHGPDSNPGGHLYSASSPHFTAYFEGNLFNGRVPSDPFDVVRFGISDSEEDAWKQYVPFETGPIVTDTVEDGYDKVLDHAGASLVRDSVDTRVVNDVINLTGSLIDHEEDVGDWPAYDTYGTDVDTDLDGMPDGWETANRLDPADADDRNHHDFHPGYTNLEVYLNEIAAAVWGDAVRPAPDPMTWAVAPHAFGDSRIGMTAVTAMDPSGVEYYFTCTAGGGNDSGWQNSPDYEDTGLEPDRQYTYTVKARDKSINQNTTLTSEPVTATTGPADIIAPSPDPMTWDVRPTSTGPSSIEMTATTAMDPSDVEYYFTCTAGGGNDSGWQASNFWEDTGLVENTEYTYTVSARDTSAARNATAPSSSGSATTEDPMDGYTQAMEMTFTGYTGVAELTDFPMLIVLDDTKIDYADFQSGGADLLFSTSVDSGVVPHEIEKWDPGGVSYIWVNVPNLGSSGDTIWMHWDNPTVSPSTAGDQVWTEGYAGVWHLAENVADASSNENHGTNEGAAFTAGAIGDVADFDGASCVSLPAGIGDSGKGTVSMWVKTDVDFTDTGHLFYARGEGGSSGDGNGGGSHNELHLNVNDDETVKGFIEGGDNDTHATGEINCADGTWRHIAFTWDQTGQAVLYVDGSVETSATYSATDFEFSETVNLGKPEQNVRFYAGDMDEVRLSKVVRSADWIKTSYENQYPNSTLIQYGTPIDTSPMPCDIDTNRTVDAIDVQLAINRVLGIDIGEWNADVDSNGTVDAVDIQKVINAVLDAA